MQKIFNELYFSGRVHAIDTSQKKVRSKTFALKRLGAMAWGGDKMKVRGVGHKSRKLGNVLAI